MFTIITDFKCCSQAIKPMSKFFIPVLILLLFQRANSQLPVLQWAKTFENHNVNNYTTYNNARTVVVDPQGNVYSAGLFNHTVDFDPGPGVFTLTGGGFDESGIYISKLDPDGNFLWAIQIPVVLDF